MPFYLPTDTAGQALNTVYAEDVAQLVRALTGQLDAGSLSLLGPVPAPSAAPTVTLAAGGVTGTGYQWGTYWITGIPDGTGTYHVTGRTTISPLTAAQALSAQEATVSIAGETVPTGAIGWGVVRNQSAGSTWCEVPGSEQFLSLAGAMPTTYVDDTPDADLVTDAPATNSTGTTLAAILSLLSGSSISGTVNGSARTWSSAGDTFDGPVTAQGLFTPNGGIAGALGASGLGGWGRPMNRNLLWNSTARYGGAGWDDQTGGIIAPVPSNTFTQFGAGSGWMVASAFTDISQSQQYVSTSHIPAGPGGVYTISGGIYAGGVTAGGVYLILQAYTSSGSWIENMATILPANGAPFQRYAASGTTPANTGYLAVIMVINGGSTIGVAGAYWSEIQVEIGPVASPYDCSGDLNYATYPDVTIPGLSAQQAGNAGGSAVFTSSGSWTVPAGVNRVLVQAWGGNGGGGGGCGGGDEQGGYWGGGGGGGGGAGGFVAATIPVTPGDNVTVTVGGGGSPGAGGSAGASGSNGGDGSASEVSFGAYSVSAPGGVGGGGAPFVPYGSYLGGAPGGAGTNAGAGSGYGALSPATFSQAGTGGSQGSAQSGTGYGGAGGVGGYPLGLSSAGTGGAGGTTGAGSSGSTAPYGAGAGGGGGACLSNVGYAGGAGTWGASGYVAISW